MSMFSSKSKSKSTLELKVNVQDQMTAVTIWEFHNSPILTLLDQAQKT